MLSDFASVIPGIGGEEVKKDEDLDVLLKESANIPNGLLAIRVFGCTNLYLDKDIIPDHFGLYVDITVGFTSRCTSVQSCHKKGRVIWDETKNFSIPVSSRVNSGFNQVHIAVIGFDKQQARPKYRLLGKIEFHLHKIVKKQWSMDAFELQNKKKRYAGDISIEFAFAYGVFGYGISEQIENVHSPKDVVDQSAFPRLNPKGATLNTLGICSIPQKVTHPKFIPFTMKVLNLEPDISSTYGLRTAPHDIFKIRPAMDQKLIRLKQLCADYSKLGTRIKRISYLKNMMSKQESNHSTFHEIEQGSDSDHSDDGTNVGVKDALAQVTQVSLLGGTPGGMHHKPDVNSDLAPTASGTTSGAGADKETVNSQAIADTPQLKQSVVGSGGRLRGFMGRLRSIHSRSSTAPGPTQDIDGSTSCQEDEVRVDPQPMERTRRTGVFGDDVQDLVESQMNDTES